MGIDYAVTQECAPRKALGSEGIIQLLKARDRAEMVMEHARSSGETDPAKVTFRVVVRTPQGDTPKDVRVQDLLDQARPLDELRPHCKGCPFDRRGQGYGCTGYLRYPIPVAAEHWLLERLPGDLSSTAGHLFRSAIRDFDWNGEHAASLREQGGTFFESDEAPSVSWGDALEVSGDQIFHMLFHVGPISPTHAMMLCLFFGLLPHDTAPEALRDTERLSHALSTARSGYSGDADLGGIDTFLDTLALAALHDLTVLTDA